MKISKTLHVTTRQEWRAWLEAHHKTEQDIWLVYYRKDSGQPRISYNDAVEEALCFGWIDSTQKALDAHSTAQRYSPRSAKSSYSQTNKERLQRLLERGLVSQHVLDSLNGASLSAFTFPQDIMRALRGNLRAWQNFQRYSPSYQRIRVAYIDSSRQRPGEFEKRLQHFLEKTEQNKQFGHDIEAYY